MVGMMRKVVPPSQPPTTVCVCTTKCKKSVSVPRVSYSAPDSSPYQPEITRFDADCFYFDRNRKLPSLRRTKPMPWYSCAGAGGCGGCDWHHLEMKSEKTEPRKKRKAYKWTPTGGSSEAGTLEYRPRQLHVLYGGNYHTPWVNHAQPPGVNKAHGPRHSFKAGPAGDVRFRDFYCLSKYIFVLMCQRWCQQMPSDFPQADSFSAMGAQRGNCVQKLAPSCGKKGSREQIWQTRFCRGRRSASSQRLFSLLASARRRRQTSRESCDVRGESRHDATQPPPPELQRSGLSLHIGKADKPSGWYDERFDQMCFSEWVRH